MTTATTVTADMTIRRAADVLGVQPYELASWLDLTGEYLDTDRLGEWAASEIRDWWGADVPPFEA